ncbi:MAG TPA: CHAD domain-containing protein [Thermoleophilaceae bacterium]
MPDFPDPPLSPAARAAVERVGASAEYRLLAEETAADGVRRVARGRVESALIQLRRKSERDLPTAVHEARKDLKKLRSLLRLVRDALGRKRYHAENARYRDAARLLAGSRDAEVKLETLLGLRRRFGSELPAAAGLEGALRAEREQLSGAVDEPRLRGQLEQAAAAIELGRAAIDDWRLDASGWKLLRPGLERSYRRGRERLAVVRSDPSVEAIHEWRKGVKDLWYQLRLLRESWPEVLSATADQAHELADLLGDHHDLSVLGEAVQAHADGAERDTLLVLIERRQLELLERALPLGARLYAEEPRRFATRLGVYWRV